MLKKLSWINGMRNFDFWPSGQNKINNSIMIYECLKLKQFWVSVSPSVRRWRTVSIKRKAIFIKKCVSQNDDSKSKIC